MELLEKTIAQQQVYHGKIFDVQRRDVTLPDGHAAVRDVVMTRHAAAVVPITAECEVLLVRQFRAAPQKVMLEIPAGKLEEGEAPEICAARELEEETGMVADTLRPLVGLWVSPAIVCEQIHIFLAQGLRPGQCNPDEDEFIERVRIPLEEAFAMVMAGEIADAKTVAGLCMARELLCR